MPGIAVQISARGNELWVINAAQEIYRWSGTFWERKAGGASYIGASPDGYSWVCNAGQGIFRWNIATGAWEQIPGGLQKISAVSRDLALGVNSNGDVFVWKNNAWAHIYTQTKWVSIGDDGTPDGDRWAINRDGTTWHWQGGRFEKVDSTVKMETVDCHSPNRVVGTDVNQKVYVWRKDKWQQLQGSASSISINHDKMYAIVPSRIKNAAFLACHDTFHVSRDVAFEKCSNQRKIVTGLSSEQCCDVCRSVPAGGGCFFVENADSDDPSTCNICTGLARGEEDYEGAVFFKPKGE